MLKESRSGSMIERRSVKRIPVTFRVNFGLVSIGRHEATICDLAINGCHLETPVPLPVNTYLELWLQISPTDPRIVVDLAAVRWARDHQVGIEFLSLQPEDRTKLQEIMQEPFPTE
jgi:hypothetical protein